MQVPKAFVPCAGRQLWEWSAEVLLAACGRVVFVVPPDRVREVVVEPDEHPFYSRPQVQRVAGGASRSESVRNGLLAVPEAGIVVVHDAARPFVDFGLVHECIDRVKGGWDGAITAAPVTDTIKEGERNGEVIRTLDRANLWAVQTPQAFSASILARALESESIASATDDASLVEAIGGHVSIVEAPTSNFKITTIADLVQAEALLC